MSILDFEDKIMLDVRFQYLYNSRKVSDKEKNNIIKIELLQWVELLGILSFK